MNIKKRVILALVALVSCTTLAAQPWEPGVAPTRGNANVIDEGSDVQARLRATIEKSLGKSWTVSWSEQVRTMDNFRKLDKIVSAVGVEYKPWEFLKFGIDYNLVNERTFDTALVQQEVPVLNNGEPLMGYDGQPVTELKDVEVPTKGWATRHRTNIDVTGMYRIGRVKLSLRERLRVQFRTDSINKYEKTNPTLSLRSRLKGAYDIRNSSWEPYAFVELYTMLDQPKPVENYKEFPLDGESYLGRVRLAVGTEVKLHNHHRLDIHYMVHFNRTYNARYKGGKGDLKEWSLEKMCNHVIGIDYKFKL